MRKVDPLAKRIRELKCFDEPSNQLEHCSFSVRLCQNEKGLEVPAPSVQFYLENNRIRRHLCRDPRNRGPAPRDMPIGRHVLGGLGILPGGLTLFGGATGLGELSLPSPSTETASVGAVLSLGLLAVTTGLPSREIFVNTI